LPSRCLKRHLIAGTSSLAKPSLIVGLRLEWKFVKLTGACGILCAHSTVSIWNRRGGELTYVGQIGFDTGCGHLPPLRFQEEFCETIPTGLILHQLCVARNDRLNLIELREEYRRVGRKGLYRKVDSNTLLLQIVVFFTPTHFNIRCSS